MAGKQWSGTNWTAGHWDGNNWLGPNEAGAGPTFADMGAVITASGSLVATLSAVSAVVPVTPQAVAGGGSSKSWKRKEYEAKALRDAIRKALGHVEEAAEVEVEDVQESAPFTKREQPAIAERYTLPAAKDYSTEQAHLSALTAALDRVYAALPAIRARRASEIAEARAKREAKVAKVRKLLRMVDLLDAA